ncbi:ABC transporter permease subunit [Alcaligenaceae bacterium]|nr:ABC transporter permease subunit [Alcaligenaceae bacterium]
MHSYAVFFSSNTYVRILIRTLVSASVVTVFCLLLGYPYAYLMSRTRGWVLQVLSGIVLLSFFTSVMVRSFAWIVLLQRNGIIDQLVQSLGMGSLVLRGTTLGVNLAMVQIMLPFMIFPLYSVMAGFDNRLGTASTSLGAHRRTTFWRIYFPLSMPGVVSGSVIVFVTSLGFYIIPGMVGGPSSQLLSYLIYSLVNNDLNVVMASTASVVMLVSALILVLPIMRRFDLSSKAVARFSVPEPMGERKPRLLLLWSGLVAALLMLPGLVVVPISFPENRSFVFPPTGFSLTWYRNFFTQPDWWGSFISSLQVAALVTVVATALSVLTALALTRVSPRARMLIRAIVLTPKIMPGIVIAIAIYGLFLNWHLNSSVTGFVIAHTLKALPFAFLPIAAALEQFDSRLEHASSSLGASKWTTFVSVVLPMIRTGMLTGGLFAFVISFDEVVVSLFLSGARMRTLPVQMYRSIESDVDPTVAAASTMLLVLTTLIVVLTMIYTNKKRN